QHLAHELARAQLDADADAQTVGVDPRRRLGRAVGGGHAEAAEVPAAAQAHFLLGVTGRVVQLLVVDLRDQRATLVDRSQAPAVAGILRRHVGLTGRVERRQRQATAEGGAVRRRTGHALRVAEGRAGVPDAVAGAGRDTAGAGRVRQPVAEQPVAHHVGLACGREPRRVVATEAHFTEAAGQADDAATREIAGALSVARSVLVVGDA